MQKTIPLKHHGKDVGTAVIEADADGVRVVSTTFTDPEVEKKYKEDILRLFVPAKED